jgi:hypothetical protein
VKKESAWHLIPANNLKERKQTWNAKYIVVPVIRGEIKTLKNI